MKYTLLWILFSLSSFAKAQSVNCHKFLANPPNNMMAEHKNEIYFLLKDDSSKRKSYVMDLNLGDLNIKRIGSLNIGDSSPIVPLGKGAKAIAVFSFHNAVSACHKGESTGLGLWLHGGKNNFRAFNRRNYSLMKTDRGSKIFDLDEGYIKEYEPTLGQKRYTVKLPSKGYPLYYSYKSATYFYFDTNTNELVKYNQMKSKVIKKLRIADNMKISQFETLFSIVMPGKKKNSIDVKWIDGWTTSGYKGYTFDVPPRFKWDNISVLINLKNRIAVVYGKDDSERSFLKSVLFVDLKTNKIIKEEFPAKGSYYSKIHYSLATNKLVLSNSPVGKKAPAVVQTFDFATQKTTQVFIK